MSQQGPGPPLCGVQLVDHHALLAQIFVVDVAHRQQRATDEDRDRRTSEDPYFRKLVVRFPDAEAQLCYEQRDRETDAGHHGQTAQVQPCVNVVYRGRGEAVLEPGFMLLDRSLGVGQRRLPRRGQR